MGRVLPDECFPSSRGRNTAIHNDSFCKSKLLVASSDPLSVSPLSVKEGFVLLVTCGVDANFWAGTFWIVVVIVSTALF